MRNSTIIGTGFYVPDKVVTNDDLAEILDTSDEWIRERTGIRERRYADPEVLGEIGPAGLAVKAVERALADAGMTADQVQMIVFSTLNPDIHFPGSGCFLMSLMDFPDIPAIDLRQQCSGFTYGVTVADQFIRTGFVDNVLVIGSENHSGGIEFADRGRDVTVIFGDGAGAIIMAAADSDDQGVLATGIHAQGKYYDKLWVPAPAGRLNPRLRKDMWETGEIYPIMEGRTVFKHAIPRFGEAINEVLDKAGYTVDDLDVFIPHQANERISRMVAQKMNIPWEKVVSNIDRYGNTTAATIPICICEAREDGRLKKGGLMLAASFGSGFTWGSFLVRWTI